MSISKQMKELVDKLNGWSHEYYVNNVSVVTDQVYDAHYNELIELENNNPSLILTNSPTQNVGNVVSEKFVKIKHESPMLSLSNAFNDEDVLKFDNQIKKLLNIDYEIEYACELKIDGLSISLTYNKGRLVKGVTRGDGVTGEDVTKNVKQIMDIPHTIPYEKKIEFRGEIYMSKNVFNNLNKDGKFANPRNVASGTIRQLDSSVVKRRKLSSFIYSIPNPLEHSLATHKDVLDFIRSNGLSCNKESVIAKNIGDVITSIHSLTETRESLGYEVDGIVIKVNNNKIHEDIGYTVKSPKYMIAYKFPEEVSETTLLDIFGTVGRTGRITYNAKLEPVRLAGTTVSAATLHNADYVASKGIQIGDVVYVKKAGEIIPKVVGVSKKNSVDEWKELKDCPSCSCNLKRYDGEVDQYCTNGGCFDIRLAKIEHFVSRKAMNIEGVSIEIVRKLMNESLINDISSLYDLETKRDKILEIRGFKAKSVNKIIDSINASKGQGLAQFIFGLGIRHIGSKNAKVLAKSFGNLESLLEAEYEKIVLISDLGSTSANSLINFLKDELNLKLIKKMKELGVNPKPEDMPISNLFEGKRFVITGTLSKGRKFFQKMIEDHKGNVSNAVSKNTSFLLAGDNAGSKKVKAEALGVVILKEEDLIKMLKGDNNG